MRINWDATGERRYEVGVDRGVLYQDVGGAFEGGVPWNGLTNIDADDNGHENTPLYTGDVKRGNLSTYSEFGGTITAYTYPDEFEPCIGSVEAVPGIFAQQQKRAHFGLCYRSLIGNDVDGQEHGYKLHLIYDAEVTSCSVSRPTINDSAEAVEFEWEFEAIPQLSDDFDPYSEIIIDSTRFSSEFMEQLEDILYGTEEEAPRLPILEELLELFYVEEPVPPEWRRYPHTRLFPSEDIYPEPMNIQKQLSTVAIVGATILPNSKCTIGTSVLRSELPTGATCDEDSLVITEISDILSDFTIHLELEKTAETSPADCWINAVMDNLTDQNLTVELGTIDVIVGYKYKEEENA